MASKQQFTGIWWLTINSSMLHTGRQCCQQCLHLPHGHSVSWQSLMSTRVCSFNSTSRRILHMDDQVEGNSQGLASTVHVSGLTRTNTDETCDTNLRLETTLSNSLNYMLLIIMKKNISHLLIWSDKGFGQEIRHMWQIPVDWCFSGAYVGTDSYQVILHHKSAYN